MPESRRRVKPGPRIARGSPGRSEESVGVLSSCPASTVGSCVLRSFGRRNPSGATAWRFHWLLVSPAPGLHPGLSHSAPVRRGIVGGWGGLPVHAEGLDGGFACGCMASSRGWWVAGLGCGGPALRRGTVAGGRMGMDLRGSVQGRRCSCVANVTQTGAPVSRKTPWSGRGRTRGVPSLWPRLVPAGPVAGAAQGLVGRADGIPPGCIVWGGATGGVARGAGSTTGYRLGSLRDRGPRRPRALPSRARPRAGDG